MKQGEFIQILGVQPAQFSWLLGAGTSQSAGLPTAVDVMWDLKRRHYCREENQQISANDVQNSAVREKITAYMDGHNFPSPGDPEEYSACFKLIFGSDYERQRGYLKAMLADDKISLSQGHRILAALMATNRARAVFTTNFDTVVEKAFAAVAGRDIAAFHLEGSYAANAALNNEEFPLYVKLHGDFRFQSLKNLASDLATQNVELGRCLANACNRFGLVVAGYSGRDDTVMALLQQALQGQNPFPQGLFWTTMKGRKPAQPVTDLIDAARALGLRAEVIEIETFDSLMSRLWRQLPDRPPTLVKAVGRTTERNVNIEMPQPGTVLPILRLNGLPTVSLPTRCWELSFTNAVEWKDLRDAEKRADGSLICTKDTAIWAWGHELSVRKTFGAELQGVVPFDISEPTNDLESNPHLKGFIEQGIALALKRGKPLVHRASRAGSSLIVDSRAAKSDVLKRLSQAVGGPVFGSVPDLKTAPTHDHPDPISMDWGEAVQVDLQTINGTTWTVLRPYVWIWPRWARQDATSFLDKRIADRFNKKADGILSAWIEILLPTTKPGSDHEIFAFDGVEGPGNPRFVLNDRTAFSRGGGA